MYGPIWRCNICFLQFADVPKSRTCNILVFTCFVLDVRAGADKSLSRPGRKQATVTSVCLCVCVRARACVCVSNEENSQQFFSYLTSHSASCSMHMYFRDRVQLECRNALMWGYLLGAQNSLSSLCCRCRWHTVKKVHLHCPGMST